VLWAAVQGIQTSNQPTNQPAIDAFFFFSLSMGIQDRINCSVTLLQLDFQLEQLFVILFKRPKKKKTHTGMQPPTLLCPTFGEDFIKNW
jgi:hypothetical protein